MRRLVKEELEAVKNEFIAYLIMQGIDAAEWKKIQSDDERRALSIIDEFSFSYFDVMLSGINYATKITSDVVHTIHYRSKDMHHFLYKKGVEDKIGQKKEQYSDQRKAAIFQFLEQGYKPDKGESYKELALLYAESRCK